MGRVDGGMSDSATADLASGKRLVEQALTASPHHAFAHLLKGSILRAQNRWQEAIPEYETALTLDRNSVGALSGLGFCKLYAGSIDEVIPLEEQAIRLSPRDRDIGFWYYLIGMVHLLQSHTDQAIVWLEKACSAIPAIAAFRTGLASAYALKGETERAAAELAEARRLSSDDRFRVSPT